MSFKLLIVCVTVLFGVAQSTLTNLPGLPDGITVHNVIATWSEARSRCHSEGAIIASPVNNKILNTLRSLISITNETFYVGIKADHQSGRFVSLEGISFENMTVSLGQRLDPWRGDCLAMTFDSIHVVPCDSRLPYICSKPQLQDYSGFEIEKTNCGRDYTYDAPSKHCYKVHVERIPWLKAQATCLAEGANLAVVDNEVEVESLKRIYGPSSWIWIGIFDLTGKGNWTSVHWQPIENLYNVWKTKEKQPNATCGYYYLSGHLHATACGLNIDFVCEKEPTF